MRLPTLLLPVAILVTAGCAAPDGAVAPLATPSGPARGTVGRAADDPAPPPDASEGVPAAVTRERLERAASGLLYTSESDYPFTYFFQPATATAPLTIEAFRAAVGVPADVPVEAISLDDFLARHIERVDPADAVAVALVPRYRVLRETIRHAVHDPRVFRVGRIAIACYAVGTDRAGNVVGLTTVAIET